MLGKKHRRDLTRHDYSQFSALTKNPVERTTPVIPGEIEEIKTTAEVIKGLPLDYNAQRDLQNHLGEWMKSPDVLVFRSSLSKGLKSFAPQDYGLRSEIFRRAVALWKSTKPKTTRMGGTIEQHVVQKSMDDELALIRPMLKVSYKPQPPEMIWCVDEPYNNIDPPKPKFTLSKGPKYLKKNAKKRYFYRNNGNLVSSRDVEIGATFKMEVDGYASHFEVTDYNEHMGVARIRCVESHKETWMPVTELSSRVNDAHGMMSKSVVLDKVIPIAVDLLKSNTSQRTIEILKAAIYQAAMKDNQFARALGETPLNDNILRAVVSDLNAALC